LRHVVGIIWQIHVNLTNTCLTNTCGRWKLTNTCELAKQMFCLQFIFNHASITCTMVLGELHSIKKNLTNLSFSTLHHDMQITQRNQSTNQSHEFEQIADRDWHEVT
jgi:hypothetical protein